MIQKWDDIKRSRRTDEQLEKLRREAVAELAASKYNFSVSWSDEDEVFIGRVAEWEGIAAHGDTHDEALEEVQNALRGAIELCEEDGDEYPKPFEPEDDVT